MQARDARPASTLAREEFNNYRSALPAGVTLDKNTPRTTARHARTTAPASTRRCLKALSRDFDATALGVYVQDLVQVAPHWKVLGGLRWDHFDGRLPAARP